MKQLRSDIHLLSLGTVNAFLIEHDEGLTLIDTGTPGCEEKILGYLADIGRSPEELRQIIVTHLHADHTGSVAPLVSATGAEVYMHPRDGASVKTGDAWRDVTVTPGLVNRLLWHLAIKRGPREVEPFTVTTPVVDNEWLDIGKGFRVIGQPGHTEGHIGLLYDGVLFTGDTVGNLTGVALAPLYEDLEEGRRDAGRLSTLDFETVLFSHGRPLLADAKRRFDRAFARFRP